MAEWTPTIKDSHRAGLHNLRPVASCETCKAWLDHVDGIEFAVLIQSHEVRMERRAAQALRRLEVAYGLNS